MNFQQLISPYLRLDQHRLAETVHGMKLENVLSQVNADYGWGMFGIPICC